MTYSKDSRSSSTSIKLTTKQGSPADCKLDYKKYGKKFLIVGYMRSKSAANATWKCVEEQGWYRNSLRVCAQYQFHFDIKSLKRLHEWFIHLSFDLMALKVLQIPKYSHHRLLAVGKSLIS